MISVSGLINYLETIKPSLVYHNRFLFDHPETAFNEYVSSAHLMQWAEEEGFAVEKYAVPLNTAFKATRTVGRGGPVIGFIAEYDALKDIGHGCGHNLIATMSFGAALAVAEAAGKTGLDCTIVIVGTPAEESGGGKILMADAGCFKGIDFAMMMHPSDKNMVEDFSFANVIYSYEFTGKPAHASAAPWEGNNALEGLLQTLNLINGYRCQFKDYSRVNPWIIESGNATNVISPHSRMEINIRSNDLDYLDELIEIVRRCAAGSAQTYGLSLETNKVSPRYAPVANCPVIERVMRKHFESIGWNVEPKARDHGVGSTDMGNVTQVIPAIHGHIKLGQGLKTHTAEFRDETLTPSGIETLVTGAAVMAATALEIAGSDENLKEMQHAFLARKASRKSEKKTAQKKAPQEKAQEKERKN